MAFAGNCGFFVCPQSRNLWRALFSEEAGAVLETSTAFTYQVIDVFKSAGVPASIIGRTTQEKTIEVLSGSKVAFTADMEDLRQTWRETSHQLRLQQVNPDCALAEKENTKVQKGISYVFPQGFDGKAQVRLRRTKNQRWAGILREIGTNSDEEMNASFMMAGFRTQNVAMSDLESGAMRNFDKFSVLGVCGGFSDGDILGSARGWAAKILYNEKLRRIFWEFLNREDSLSYWVCNGAQLFGHLGVVMGFSKKGPLPENRPRFIYNTSRKFEARWSLVGIQPNSTVMLRGMEGCRLGVHTAHGEGRFYCPDKKLFRKMLKEELFPARFVDDSGEIAGEKDYPANPNGSPLGITSMCWRNRHLAAMTHFERTVQMRQWQYLPEELKYLENSPWLRAFENMRNWYR
jgi:phosphoribosylformylglycinamidine synthase